MTNFVCWHKNRGEKFRTAFRQLGGLRALTSAPLTASAPPSIEAEVKATLELHVHDCVMVSLLLDQPNIYISSKKNSLSVSWLLLVYIDSVLLINFIILYIQCDLGGITSQMRSCHSPDDFPKTLVFCKTKSQCVKIFTLFTAMSTHKGLISMYHATLSEETKAFLYRQFTARQSDLRCLVCTITFGMVSNSSNS